MEGLPPEEQLKHYIECLREADNELSYWLDVIQQAANQDLPITDIGVANISIAEDELRHWAYVGEILCTLIKKIKPDFEPPIWGTYLQVDPENEAFPL